MSISTQTNDAQVALDHIHKSTATTFMLPSVGHSITVQEDDDEDAIVEEITKPNTQARIHDWIYLIYRTYYTYCYWLLSVNCLCLNCLTICQFEMLDSKGRVSKPRLFWEPREIFVRRGEVGRE